MDANTYYLNQYLDDLERSLMVQEYVNEKAYRLYENWIENPPAAEIIAALWDINDDELKLLKVSLQNNNEQDAGKIVFAVIKRSLMYAAKITARES